MHEYIIQESSLTNIADAIRDKTKETELLSTSQMAEKIRTIVTREDIHKVEGVRF